MVDHSFAKAISVKEYTTLRVFLPIFFVAKMVT